MPLKLFRRKGAKKKNYTIRGVFLGERVFKATGTSDYETAKGILAALEHDIRYGKLDRDGPTFEQAALAYVEAGGEKTYMKRLSEHFRGIRISAIDQAAIDNAALMLYPGGSAATRNRSVYTPVSSVLRRAGMRIDLRRPEGSGGRKQTTWLWPEQATALIGEALKLNREFGILLIVLLYTGMRLSEVLGLTWQNMRLEESYAHLPKTKNDDPRAVFLPRVAVDAIRDLPKRRRANSDKSRVFRFHKSGHLYFLLRAAAAKAGVELPERSAFHLMRHTYATWMMRYGGLNTRQLRDAGGWKDEKSTNRYAHTIASEDAGRAANLPVVWSADVVQNSIPQNRIVDKTDS